MKISSKLLVRKLRHQKQTARYWPRGVSFPPGISCSLASPGKAYRWALLNLGLLGEPLTIILRAGELLQAMSSNPQIMINPHGEAQQGKLQPLMWILSHDLPSLPHVLLGISLWVASAAVYICWTLSSPGMCWPLPHRSYLSHYQYLLHLWSLFILFFFFFWHVSPCSLWALSSATRDQTWAHSSKSTEI